MVLQPDRLRTALYRISVNFYRHYVTVCCIYNCLLLQMVCVLDVSMATTMLDDQIHLRVQDLNPVLTCELCGGYYVGATTITTCLHTCKCRFLFRQTCNGLW